MRLFVLFCLLAVVSAVTIPVDTDTRFLFDSFVSRYNKQYKDSTEYQQRLQVFAQNLAYIKNHNAQNYSYTLGLTPFADMTNAEYRENVVGHSYRPTNRTRINNIARVHPVGTLPATVDWRQKGVVTGVKNQGQCGSCWSFSATGSMEGAHALSTGDLVSLSEQQLIDCCQGGSFTCDTGGDMQDAFQYVIDAGGIEGESDYPYCTCSGNPCQANPALFKAKISSYQNVAQGSESALQSAVANQPTVSVAIDASSMEFQLYSGGVFDYPLCSSTQLDHGVLAVGYGTYNGQAYWLVKNSWGASWGLQGYIMMSRNKNNQCGIATDASFPLV